MTNLVEIMDATSSTPKRGGTNGMLSVHGSKAGTDLLRSYKKSNYILGVKLKHVCIKRVWVLNWSACNPYFSPTENRSLLRNDNILLSKEKHNFYVLLACKNLMILGLRSACCDLKML